MKKAFLRKIFAMILSLCFVRSTMAVGQCVYKNRKNVQNTRSVKVHTNTKKPTKPKSTQDTRSAKARINKSEKQSIKKPFKIPDIGNLYGGNLKKFISNKTRDNSVLLLECNRYHHECLPGFAKYFLELGYNVDVLTWDIGVDSFAIFDKTDKLKIYSYSDNKEMFDNMGILRSRLGKYKHIFLNTSDYGNTRVFNSLNILNLPKSIVVSHTTNSLVRKEYNRLLKQKKVVTLGEFNIGTYVNPHYFGQIPRTDKNKTTNFVAVGELYSRRRNYNQLFEAVKKLSGKSLDFKITAFGRRKNVDIPKDVAPYIDFKGALSYKDMYNEIKNADFILMLLDPSNEEHQRYKAKSVTGNAQLAYGFNKPVIINKEFADFYHFTSDNSIIEENGDLGTAMEKAINCSQDEYSEMQDNLKITSDEIFKKSLENLKMMTK